MTSAVVAVNTTKVVILTPIEDDTTKTNLGKIYATNNGVLGKLVKPLASQAKSTSSILVHATKYMQYTKTQLEIIAFLGIILLCFLTVVASSTISNSNTAILFCTFMVIGVVFISTVFRKTYEQAGALPFNNKPDYRIYSYHAQAVYEGSLTVNRLGIIRLLYEEDVYKTALTYLEVQAKDRWKESSGYSNHEVHLGDITDKVKEWLEVA